MQEFLQQLTPFDYICTFIVFYCIVSGLVRGFVKELSGVVSLLLSVSVAKILSVPITIKLYNALKVREKVLYKLETVISEVYTSRAELTVAELENKLDLVLEKFSFIGDYVSKLVREDFEVYEILVGNSETFIQDLSLNLMGRLEPVIQYFLSAVMFILLCMVVSFLVKYIMKSISSILNSVPLVGVMDSVLGGCLGGVKGVCLVTIVTLATFILASIFGNLESGLLKSILDSKVFDIISYFKFLII